MKKSLILILILSNCSLFKAPFNNGGRIPQEQYCYKNPEALNIAFLDDLAPYFYKKFKSNIYTYNISKVKANPIINKIKLKVSSPESDYTIKINSLNYEVGNVFETDFNEDNKTINIDISCTDKKGITRTSTYSINLAKTYDIFHYYKNSSDDGDYTEFGYDVSLSKASNGSYYFVAGGPLANTLTGDVAGGTFEAVELISEGFNLGTKLSLPTAGEENQRLGYSLYSKDNYVYIASRMDNDRGAVSFFKLDGETNLLLNEITGSEIIEGSQEGEYFGWSISRSNNTLIIGSPKYKNDDDSIIGKITVCKLNEFGYVDNQSECIVKDNYYHGLLGTSVDSVEINNKKTLIAVSSPTNDHILTDTGIVNFFIYDEETNTLSDLEYPITYLNNFSYFGASLSIKKSVDYYYLLVGAPGCKPDFNNGFFCELKTKGKAYVIKFKLTESGISEKTQLIVDNPETTSELQAFGYRVKLSDDLYFAVSSPRASSKNGKVDIFRLDTNNFTSEHISTFRPVDTSKQLNYGGSVDIIDNFLIVGSMTDGFSCSANSAYLPDLAWFDDCSYEDEHDTGAVYVYKFK